MFIFLLCFVFWGVFWHKRFNITFLITYNNLRKCLVNNIDYNLRSAINSKSMEVTHELKMTFLLVNLFVENQNQSAFFVLPIYLVFTGSVDISYWCPSKQVMQLWITPIIVIKLPPPPSKKEDIKLHFLRITFF